MRALLSHTLLAALAAGSLAVTVSASAAASRSDRTASAAQPSAPATPGVRPPLVLPAGREQARGVHAFYFTRAMYSDYRSGRFGGRGRGSWATDWPKSDLQFITVLRRLTNLDVYHSDHVVRLDDPELRRYPFLYMLEVGGISLTQAEVDGLRGYLLAGGFVFVDDFWGDGAWYAFEQQMRQVLPEYPIVELTLEHPVFKAFYAIDALQQMPSINHWRSGQSTECWGCEYRVRGIFADDGRLLMLINWNTDNGDAWEWAEQPDIPLKFTTYAYQLGVNAIVYSMSH